MKEFKRKKIIDIPIYPFRLHLCLLNEEGLKYLENKHRDTDARTEKEGLEIFIYFKEKPRADSVAHEVFHATEFIMLEIGQKLGDSPNETWAYLMGYLMDECDKFLRRK